LTKAATAVATAAELVVNCRIPVLFWALTKTAYVYAKFTGCVLLTAVNILAANRSYSLPIPVAIVSMK